MEFTVIAAALIALTSRKKLIAGGNKGLVRPETEIPAPFSRLIIAGRAINLFPGRFRDASSEYRGRESIDTS